MKTIIKILDAGTFCSAEVGSDGRMTVTQGGGCPVADILAPINFSPRRKVGRIASDVMSQWCRGYAGSPACSELTVEVIRGDESVEVAAQGGAK